MKLIDEWTKAYKLHSVQIAGGAAFVAGLASEVWNRLDTATQETILNKFGLGGILKVVASVFVAVLIARLRAQAVVSPPTPTDEESTK